MKSIFLMIMLLLAACATPLTPEQQAKAERMAALFKKIADNYVPVIYVSISCDDHTSALVTGFAIQDLQSTEQYGGGSCGGTNAAGYPLPKQWRPGMKVKVRWKLDGKPWRETSTNIMRYSEAGTVFIHIYDNDQVRVVASSTYPGGAKHPISGDSKIPPPAQE
jgi:hypothetical protein